jgi:hypothetical protein
MISRGEDATRSRRLNSLGAVGLWSYSDHPPARGMLDTASGGQARPGQARPHHDRWVLGGAVCASVACNHRRAPNGQGRASRILILLGPLPCGATTIGRPSGPRPSSLRHRGALCTVVTVAAWCARTHTRRAWGMMTQCHHDARSESAAADHHLQPEPVRVRAWPPDLRRANSKLRAAPCACVLKWAPERTGSALCRGVSM